MILQWRFLRFLIFLYVQEVTIISVTLESIHLREEGGQGQGHKKFNRLPQIPYQTIRLPLMLRQNDNMINFKGCCKQHPSCNVQPLLLFGYTIQFVAWSHYTVKKSSFQARFRVLDSTPNMRALNLETPGSRSRKPGGEESKRKLGKRWQARDGWVF